MAKKIISVILVLSVVLFFALYLNRDFFIINNGIFNFRKGNYDKAIDILSRMTEKHPGDYDAVYYLARSHWKLCKYQKSEKVLRNFATNNPENADVQKELARSLYLRGKLDESLLFFQKAAGSGRLSPQWIHFKDALSLFLSQKPYDSLKRIPGDAFESAEDESIRLSLKGVCLYKAGVSERSESFLRKSLEYFRDNPLSLSYLAMIMIDRDKPYESHYLMDKARSLGFAPQDDIFLENIRLLNEEIIPGLVRNASEGVEVKLEELELTPDSINVIPDDESVIYGFFKNGRIDFKLTHTGGERYILYLEARGTPSSNIWPRAQIFINGIDYETIYVSRKGWSFYPVSVVLSSGENRIGIAYINDSERLEPASDRNLFMRRIYIK